MPKSIEEIAREEGMLPPPLGEPDIDATLPNTLRFKWDQPTPLRIRAEQIWKDRQGIHCWLTFHTHDNGTIYGPTRVNLQSASAIASLRRELRDRETQDWASYIQKITEATYLHLQNSGETLTAATYVPKPEPPWLVWPFVKAGLVSTTFADGGSGKSTLYTAVCLSGAAGISVVPGLRVTKAFPTLYVDFEASPDDVIGAAVMLAKAANLPDGWQERFMYRRYGGSLSEHSESIQRIVSEYGVELAIIDSLVGSAGSDPNDAETARAFFSSANSLPGCAVVGLTHISKESKGKSQSPLGSVMYRNLPRIVWNMKRDDDSNTVGLYPNKINSLGEKPVAFALTLEVTETGMRYQAADIGAVATLAAETGPTAQIVTLLTGTTMTVAEIAAELAPMKDTVIRSTLNRGRGKRFIQHAGAGAWGLMEKAGDTGETLSHPPVRGADVSTPDRNALRNVSTDVSVEEKEVTKQQGYDDPI